MGTEKIYNNAVEIAKFVSAPDDIKLDIFAKYGLIADATYGGAGFDLIKNNKETFLPLLSPSVTQWAMMERNKPIYTKAVQANPRISKVFSNQGNVDALRNAVLKELSSDVNPNETYENVITGMRLFGIESIDNIEDIDGLEEIEEYNENETSPNVEFDDGISFDELMNEGKQPVVPVKVETVPTNEVKETNKEVNESTTEEAKKTSDQKEEVEGYIEKIHGGYRRQIEKLILSSWEALYSYHVDGKEIVDGFIVPGGAILGTGEQIRYEGVLTLDSRKIVVKPNTMSNAIYEEFVNACRSCGISMIQEVADNAAEVKPFKYNPMLQRMIASGAINKEAFKGGWESYSRALAPYIEKKTKELAIRRSETGSDEETYKVLSGYIVSLMVVNYKDELGTQLRICCGDTSKTQAVAEELVTRLQAREKTHKSIAQGKLVVGNAMMSDNGLSATISLYQNMEGYQSVPQFMGELLCNLQEGMFQPSLKKMVIGVDLKNNIVTAPFTKWLLPIIAGSRSGKGVLTLNMLLNVIGGGTPLFYLDGKPDMATLLWKLQEKHNIPKSIVVDGVSYEGITDIDRKPFTAPYAPNVNKAMQSQSSDAILENNFGVMIYLKTMLVLLLSITYYKEHMGTKYGEIFVVFDEMYKVMKTQLETLSMNIDTEIAKLDKADKERKTELTKIKMWATELLNDYVGKDIGVFGAGIKAVALTQFGQVTSYGVTGLSAGKTFCENFLLKRGVKLFGRQEGGSGTYGVARDKNDDVNFDLYDKYFHFGIGTEQGNTFNNLKTFKPLLVLNENDCSEATGQPTDGAFTGAMLERVSQYSDVNQFRNKYFTDERLSASIGFEGALAEVGRLLGVDWQDMLSQSLSRAYEIADGALRYYNIIGLDGIDDVYDFICSFEVSHLWSYNEIIRAKKKGISLGAGGEMSGVNTEDNSVFVGLQDDGFNEFEEGGSDEIDFGDNTLDTQKTVDAEGVFGGAEVPLTREEMNILKDIQARQEAEDSNILEEVIEEPIGDSSIFENVEVQQDNAELTEEIANADGELNSTEGEVNNIDENNNAEGEMQELLSNIRNQVYEPKPEDEGVNANTPPVFEAKGKTGKQIHVTPTETTTAMKLTPENSIVATLGDSHPLETFESKLFKTLKGADYEFSKRWDAMLSAVSKRINSDLITRVLLVQDEMYVNGRLVTTVNILGGFENIRLEDIVDFKELFKRFKNIKELTLDMTMVERFQIEQPNLPVGFFMYSPKLMRINIMLSNGKKEVINRTDESISESTQNTINQAKFRNQFESVCAANNPTLKNKSVGYNAKVLNATKTFGGNSWDAINRQIKKENPSLMKAVGIGMFALPVVVGMSALYGIGGLFNLFRRQ